LRERGCEAAREAVVREAEEREEERGDFEEVFVIVKEKNEQQHTCRNDAYCA
jgi:hypothetical protein